MFGYSAAGSFAAGYGLFCFLMAEWLVSVWLGVGMPVLKLVPRLRWSRAGFDGLGSPVDGWSRCLMREGYGGPKSLVKVIVHAHVCILCLQV